MVSSCTLVLLVPLLTLSKHVKINKVMCSHGSAGHGGPNAADFVRQNLFESLVKNPKFGTDVKTAFGECQYDFKHGCLLAHLCRHQDCNQISLCPFLMSYG